MAITVTCACGQGFRVKDELAGKKVKCPKCSQLLSIPDLQGGEAPGELSLDDLMKMDAAAPTLPGMGMPGDPAGAAPGAQAQFPAGAGFPAQGAGAGAGGFQSPGFPFGQAAAPKSSSGMNKKLLAICGLGGFALLAIGALVVMLMRGGDDKQPVATNNPGPTATTPSASNPTTAAGPGANVKPLALAALGAVMLEPGGRATVELRVERNGNEGPIQVQVAGAPQGITATPAEIPAGQSVGQLALVADAAAADKLSGKLDVTIKAGQAQATQSVAVTVNKLNLPAFQPVEGIIVQPGTTATINLALQRNGYAGPVEMRPEGVSDKITIRATNIADAQSESKLEIVAAPDAPEAAHMLRVAGSAQGRLFNLTIPLQIAKEPFRVNSFMVVTLKPGEAKTVQVPVERLSYQGAVKIGIENLPEGVTIPNIELPPGQAAASVTLTAAPDTKELIRTAKVVASAAHLTASDVLLVRISRGENGFLPREVTSNKELAGLLRKGSFGGRLTSESKHALLEAYGGTPESEQAVLQGLRWLAAHQQQDGRWSLKNYHQGISGCNCHTEFEKDVQDNDTAGTAFGLLPFLGAGITHTRAPSQPAELDKYRRVVKDGLDFLKKNQVVKEKDVKKIGNLGGTMYSHALGTMALCEAYGLSGDETLKIPAQRAVRYLIEAQHYGGGWCYSPNTPGDMSVTGWVFLAIRDGQLASLPVPSETLTKSQKFLDSVANGPTEAKFSRYGYQPGKDATIVLTSAGLLSRQYAGWKQDNADLVAGCKFMMGNLPPKTGPVGGPLGSIYYYYYATQVLHHMEGEQFDLWNYRMREHLIRTQQRYSHKAGSWEAEGAEWAQAGGRLYSTALALLTLEVYYRHLPMYRSLTQLKELTKTKE